MEKWETVVFSDEKKFKSDGPNSSECYWHDLRKEKRLFSKILFGGSIMAWGGFSAFGKADLVVMERKQNSDPYINGLEKKSFTNNAIFQQDNAAIHTSKLIKDWFKTKKILKFWTGPLNLQI